MLTDCAHILDSFAPISLDEMSSIRLMNRIDTKYLASEDQLKQLLLMAQGEYMVQSINGVRQSEYSTQYLDDRFNTMYLNHHNGRLTRQKVRIRTYVDTGDYFFEIKLKNNHGRTKKKRIHLTGADTYVQDGAAQFLEEHAMLSIPLSDLNPKVANHFKRITLVNNAKTERLTIDRELSFHNNETGLDKSMDRLVVIEVKRDGNTYSPIQDLLREVRIFPSGFSKYCIGMALTTPGIKRNLFNDRIRKIEKITSTCL
ncbi:MAG: polyphosphate polymerase domain-containing protein [Bacteroidaceae bacterium]|nr:polyphosphate polymerase domain-containing protein [Bacteroidaceae bacterium]MBP5347410.1 polyphosphate polymerase domain-containing protein [Bacteroidaceae bacterium]MBR4594223.1 polyphosphate polymerase domain-containing protein [Bacteroidaceae bacterium]